MDLLNQYNQQHVLDELSKLDGENKKSLLQQLESFDLKKLMNLYDNRNDHDESESKISPINGFDLTIDEKDKYNQLGLKAITNNEVAVVLMAGGQGTHSL